MLTITVLYLAFPVLILQSSYSAIYAHFKKIHHFKVPTHSRCILHSKFQKLDIVVQCCILTQQHFVCACVDVFQTVNGMVVFPLV